MMKKVNYQIFGLILLTIYFCGCRDVNLPQKISSRNYSEFYFVTPDQNIIVRLGCKDLISGPIQGKSMYKYSRNFDAKFNKELLEMLNGLKNEETDKKYDARINVLVHHGNATDTICMNGQSGIRVNGILKKDNAALFKLIKDELFK